MINQNSANVSSKECDPESLKEIKIFKTSRLVDTSWLEFVIDYGFPLIPEFEKDLDKIRFIRTGKIGVYSIRDHVMVFIRPVLYKEGFRVIPNFPRYAVNKSGVVFDIKKQKEVSEIYNQNNKSAYPTVDIYVPSVKEIRSIGVHRLVCLAWVPNDNVIEKRFVNHKDGVKTNYASANLEWVTPSKNNTHAFEAGLRTDNRPCTVRDIKTGEIQKFVSCSEASRFMGVKLRKQSDFVLTFPESLVKRRFEVRLEGDSRPWVYETKKEFEPPSRYKILVRENGNLIHEINGVREYIKIFKLWNISNNAFTLTKEAKKRFPNYEFEVVDRNPILPVEAKNVKTGEIVTQPSIKAMCRHTDLTPIVIKAQVRRKDPYPVKGWLFRYKSTSPWPEASENRFRPRRIEIKDPYSQEVLSFSSLREAQRHLGLDRSTIKRRAVSSR